MICIAGDPRLALDVADADIYDDVPAIRTTFQPFVEIDRPFNERLDLDPFPRRLPKAVY
jgi:hypothetical protein